MKFMTTGQFATFCGTSKGTLIFYDRQGLLKPRHTSENGYRRYGSEQFYDFDVISMLKETGSSLAEIKRFLLNRDPKQILLLLEEKKLFLKMESERLAQRRAMVDKMSEALREASQLTYDILSFADLQEDKLELVPVKTDPLTAEDDDAVFATQYSEYIKTLGGTPQILYGVMINKENLDVNRYSLNCFFHRASHSTQKTRLHVRISGRYAVFSHRGDIRSHINAYRRFLAEIKEAGLRITGPMYAYDLMSYLVVTNTEEYATKYCVLVDR